MIYQNLFETWAKIASDELAILPTGEFELLKTKDWDIYAECKSLHASFFDEAETFDTLQGYIQRCVEDRSWQLFLTNTASYSAIEIQVDSTRYKAGGIKADTTISKNLLTAYLTALAAQRSPNPGAWQHFKGSEYKLICECEWKHFDGKSDFDAITEPYLLESSLAEGIELEVGLWLGGLNCEPWNYYTSSDNRNYGKLVFYKGSSGRWARKPDDFLSLVGSEHPEHQGKLRFTEVSNAKA